MTYSLPADLATFVNDEVAAGRYHSADEMVAAALQLMQERAIRSEALRRELQKGMDDFERGDFITLDSDEAIADYFAERIRESLERAEAKRHSA